MNRAVISAFRLFALALILGMVPAGGASAAMFRHAKNFILPGPETIHDDLYAGGTVVDIQGTVDGDLVVAGQTVTIGGIVTGDVIAAGRDITITGSVAGTVRVAGSSITVDGTVGHDVLAGCGTLVIGPHATVGRDVLAGAGNSSFAGRISRDVRAGSSSATFSGTVGGTVYARAKEVRLDDGALLEGDLFYTSRNALDKSPGATVRGRVEQRMPPPEAGRRRHFGSPIIGWFQGLIGFAILGALLYLPFAGAGTRTLETLQSSPWASLGFGALLAFAVPVAAAFLFVFGLIFGGWWIAFGAVLVYPFALATGYVIAATHVGRRVLTLAGRGGTPLVWALLLGLAVLGVVTAIPFLGALAGCVAALFGLGALAVAWYHSRQGERPAAPGIGQAPAVGQAPAAT